MFDLTKVKKWDGLAYKPEGSADIIGNVITFFQHGGKYAHVSRYTGDLLLQVCLRYIQNPEDVDLIRILNHTGGFIPLPLTPESVQAFIDNPLNVYGLMHSICESHIKSGVVITPLDTSLYSLIDIYRYKNESKLRANDKELEKAFLSKIGNPYDAAAFPATFMRSTIAQFFGWKNFSKSRPIFNNRNAQFCSEYDAEAMYRGHCPLSSKMNFMNMTPTDNTTCKTVKFIC
jgi:hypothetical protein